MRKRIAQAAAVFVLLGICLAAAPSRPAPRRIGMIIEMKADKIAAYKALHAASNPGVRDLLSKYHMKNFSIFLQQVDDGKYYLFGYYEYDGKDYESDMAKLAAEPRNIEWLKTTDPMQTPLRGRTSWTTMAEVYHND